ncbi:hypothetical protein SRABI118_00997 [Massilia sp. Bi118]|uniref:hypothetical protein n=1 Tax=Massilia sp. Bi118 TaxID=2822346 RepID=UPI001DDE317D|nr:hypothetical protein [Massilia sp. Bi118]CAH0171124.1 hypothetical protein SRABI118_00997 [Massilia sp. Bi118]
MERDDKERQQSSDDGKALPGGGQSQAGSTVDRLRPWRRISGQLVTLIGENGFCALFGRALRTLAARYEWLRVDPTQKSIGGLLGSLERDLAGAEPTVADIANGELLNTFTRQLSSLIGEALTARLLEQARASEQQGPEDVQEHK